MADTARGKVSMAPVVTIAADSDTDTVDAIHHDIKQRLGGNLEYEKADACDRWFYDSAKTLSGGMADLISGNFTDSGTVDADADKVHFLYVRHTGVDSSGDASTADMYINFDAGAAASTDSVVIGANESFIVKLKATPVGHIHAKPASGEIVAEVVAIIDDDSCTT